MSQIIDKPWGKEIIISNENTPYTGKIIHINAGKRWSLQYHDQKSETFACFSGQANLITGTSKESITSEPMQKDMGYTIIPGTYHRIEAITDTIIFEVSTPEIGTTYRVEDDYQRKNETEEIRNSPNRGWQQ